MSEQAPKKDLTPPEIEGRVEDPAKAEAMAYAGKPERDKIEFRNEVIDDLNRHIFISDILGRGDRESFAKPSLDNAYEESRSRADSKVEDFISKHPEEERGIRLFESIHGGTKGVIYGLEVDSRTDDRRADEKEKWAGFLHDLPNSDPELTPEKAIRLTRVIHSIEDFIDPKSDQSLVNKFEQVAGGYYGSDAFDPTTGKFEPTGKESKYIPLDPMAAQEFLTSALSSATHDSLYDNEEADRLFNDVVLKYTDEMYKLLKEESMDWNSITWASTMLTGVAVDIARRYAEKANGLKDELRAKLGIEQPENQAA